MEAARSNVNRKAKGLRLLLPLLWIIASPAWGTTILPMSLEDLTRDSAAVVIGDVKALRSGLEAGAVRTEVELKVEQVLKGTLASSTLYLTEPGGEAAGMREVVFGAPAYAAGERVVVFVRVAADGTLRTNQLVIGKFTIESEEGGQLRAARRLEPGTSVVVAPGIEPWRGSIPLEELIAEVERVAASDPAGGGATSVPFSGPRPGFTLLEDNTGLAARYFERDEGQTVRYLVDGRGDSIIGFDAAMQAIEDAFRVWNDVGSANVDIEPGDLISDLSLPCTEGLHKIRFDDPDDDIDPQVNCTGVLGIGGFCTLNPSDIKHFNDTDFGRTVRGFVTLADGWDGCPQWTPCNVAEILTHEVGHSLGLGHSSESATEADPVLRDATMYFRKHGDDRCAAVRQDDVSGITFIYPLEIPPTITGSSQLPEAVFGEPYSQTLTAMGGSGNLTFSSIEGPCPHPGLTLSPQGVIEGSAQATGTACFDARATDANGDSHTRRLFLNFVETPSNPSPTPSPTPTPTTTRTATPSLTPTATRTSPPVEDCAGDCNGNRRVTVAEVVQTVNIALGRRPPSSCPMVDANGDGSLAIDELLRVVLASLASCTP